MRLLLVSLALPLALVFTSSASAGISVDAVTPHSVRAGETLRLRVSAGLRLWQKIPLFLVPSSLALRPRPCGRRGICEPKVSGPPNGGGYIRNQLPKGACAAT